MIKLLFYLYLLLALPAALAYGQSNGDTEERKRLIYFTDKNNSPYSVSEPQQYLSPKALERRRRQNIAVTSRDFPVNPAYKEGLKQTGVKVWYTSRWFNAAVVQCSEDMLSQLEALPYVRSSRTLNRIAFSAQEQKSSQKLEGQQQLTASALAQPDSSDYGLTFHQANMLGVPQLHAAGFNGEGMTIAVFDTGFPAVNTIPAFSHLFEHNQLKGTFDFVQKQQNVFNSHSHGTSVLSTMAAYEPGKIIGTAYKANYLLFRTEDASSEHNIEEINWLLAAEYADSAGADVINSSLGYSTFDAPSVSYTYNELNGNTALVTRAADYAAATGMLVVVSAGNEGNKAWRYLTAPADADSVLSVGAVDSLGTRAIFSSFGPTADGRIKPDVVALGFRVYVLSTTGNLVQSYGTSFSGPIVAGFAASLWQAYPNKSNLEMIQLVRKSGSNASMPDSAIGYGIPSFGRTLRPTAVLPAAGEDTFYITNPVLHNEIVLEMNQEWAKNPVSLNIFDATGKLVYSQKLPMHQTQHIINLKAGLLKQGLYLCRLRSGKRSATVRFVKL